MSTAISVYQPLNQPVAEFKRINQLLDLKSPVLIRAVKESLPPHMNYEHFCKMALFTIRQSPKILNCTELSIFQAINEAAGLGLEIDGITGHGYLIPYKDQCEFVPGYRGLIELCRRSGQVASFESHIVRPHDEFRFAFGTQPYIQHIPAAGDKNTKFDDWTWAYALVRFVNGGSQFEVMSYAEVMDHKRKHSPSQSRSDSPWNTNEVEMAKKTVVRRLVKYLPVSPIILRKAMLDEYEEAGVLDVQPQQQQLRSQVVTPDFLESEPPDDNQQPGRMVDDNQGDTRETEADWQRGITDQFSAASLKGLAAVESLYDRLAGPDSQYTSEQIAWITETRDICRRRLQQSSSSKGDAGSRQRRLDD